MKIAAASPTQDTQIELEIATPCKASWEKMSGDNRRRFCHECKKHVYNFANFSEIEIANLLKQDGVPMCARLYKRSDGTILTADCPIGVRIFTRIRLLRFSLASILTTMIAGTGLLLRLERPPLGNKLSFTTSIDSTRDTLLSLPVPERIRQPYRQLVYWALGAPPRLLMGEIAFHLPPSSASGSTSAP